MLIYNSMILWVLLMTILYELFWKHSVVHIGREHSNEKIPMFVAILTFGYIIFWAGIRSGIIDTTAYINMFKNTSTNFSDIFEIFGSGTKAPGFEVFNILFKIYVSKNYHVWLMTIAIISGFSVMNVLRKHSVDFMYSAFLFVVTLNFFWMFNGIRQFIAVAIGFCLLERCCVTEMSVSSTLQ